MDKFVKLSGIAAPLRMINVDTDIIIPKQFLKTIKRAGLGIHAFNDIRYNEDGSEKDDFILNKPAYRGASILITGENFGCGSSREHAPWAILDMGIRCVIAESVSDIIINKTFKNGILPIRLPKEQVELLMKETEDNPGTPIEVDLERQMITRGNKFAIPFEVEAFRKHCLLNGLDDIGLTEVKKTQIADFESSDKHKRPWI